MKRVLIVDDALDLGRMLRTALETLDPALAVRVLPSAEEALLEVSSAPTALMVTDIRLPGMSGIELLRKVRQRSPETRIILITGLTDEETLRQAAAAGAEHFMRKPIQVGEFLEIAAGLLGLPAHQPQAAAGEPDANLPASLSELLSGLRRELGAQLVLLAGDHGQVLAQAGEMPGLDFENQWAPDLMAALSTIGRASRLIQPGLPQAALALRGTAAQLILAPVGDFALLVVQGKDASGLRTALTFETVLQTQAEIARTLKEMAVDFYRRTDTPAGAVGGDHPIMEDVVVEEVLPPLDEPPLDQLESLLAQTPAGLDADSLEDFWEAAAEPSETASADPDILSYDQARQLGLTPEGEE